MAARPVVRVTVHFSEIQSFHKHAMEVHGATENLHECSICQNCNKMVRVQTDSNKNGHVCEDKGLTLCLPSVSQTLCYGNWPDGELP